MIEWHYFPKNEDAIDILKKTVDCFKECHDKIDSSTNDDNETRLESNDVLDILRPYLVKLGFDVEDRAKKNYITRPVLFGKNGKVEKSFRVDAYHKDAQTIIEVEAGRAVQGNQVFKDFFEACAMYNVDYLVLAARKTYRSGNDFESIITLFDTLFASGRLKTPLKGILIIGY
jgi:hypothetical protein